MHSDLSTIANVGTFIAALTALLGIWIALHTYRRQMNAQLFLAYTQRYETIMCSLPAAAFRVRFDTDAVLPPRSPDLTLTVLRYLNLCSEEFYLCRVGHLDRKLWRIWEHELQRMLRSQLIRREWPELRREFASYPDFLNYVAVTQRGAPDSSASDRDIPAAVV
jgi:hypothetical protein